jgi:hypothetical protein
MYRTWNKFFNRLGRDHREYGNARLKSELPPKNIPQPVGPSQRDKALVEAAKREIDSRLRDSNFTPVQLAYILNRVSV